MNDLEIRDVLKNLSIFYGVFSSDNLPLIPNGKAIVVNTKCLCNKRGGHWLGIFKNNNGITTFFDSYGLPPKFYNLEKYLGNCIYDTRCIQSFTSLVCGAYVVTFILAQSVGISIEDYKNSFTVDRLYNDIFIRNFMLKHFNIDVPLFNGKKWW